MNTAADIEGHLCVDCRFIWICRLLPRQVTYLDPDTSPTLGSSARAFIESTRRIVCAVEKDSGHGEFDCLICNQTDVDGHKAVAYMVS